MHKRIVLNVISRILLVTCLVLLIPLGIAVSHDIHSLETKAFSETIAFGVILSLMFLFSFRLRKPDFQRVNARDGLAIVGISWILLSAVGALPLYLSHVVGTYTDAFFEIVSGFTTTGASVFADVESLPRGILFWRCLTQWLGGMGIIVLFIALLPALGTQSSQLYKAEAPGISVERVEPRIKETAKKLWSVYFFLSLLETVLLMMGDMSLYDALCHTFTTMATGGFSTRNASIGAFGPYVQWVVTVFMFFAGINFILHYLALVGKPKPYYRDEEFRMYFLFIVVLVAGFAAVLHETATSAVPLRDAAFQVVSILTTTGYSTVDFGSWPPALRFLLVMLMFVGGCGGSTGGGMKFIRFYLTVKIALRAIVQAAYPSAVVPIKINSKPLNDKMVMSVLAFFMIFIHLLFIGTFAFAVSERCDIITAFTAAIAALSNIGPGLGAVGPAENYGWVSIPGKWILSFLMLAGRLELFSILVLFLPTTWRK